METTLNIYTESAEEKFSLKEKRKNDSLESLLWLTKKLLKKTAIIHDLDLDNGTEFYWSILDNNASGKTVTLDFTVDFSKDQDQARSIPQEAIVSLDIDHVLEKIKKALSSN